MRSKMHFVSFLAVLLCFLTLTHPQTDHSREYSIVKVFPHGEGSGEILRDTMIPSSGYGVGFSRNISGDRLVVYAPQNMKLLIMDNMYRILEERSLVYGIFDEGFYLSEYFNLAVGIDEENTFIVSLNGKAIRNRLDHTWSNQERFWYRQRYTYLPEMDLFYVPFDHDLEFVVNAVKESGRARAWMSSKEFIQSREGLQLERDGLSVSGKAVFYRGFSVSTDFYDFLKACNWDKNKVKESAKNVQIAVSAPWSLSEQYKLSLIDMLGNYYWFGSGHGLVFDKHGYLIGEVNATAPDIGRSVAAHFLPNGDLIEFFTPGRKQPTEVRLYENKWTPETKAQWKPGQALPRFITDLCANTFAYPFGIWKEATINENDVSLRGNPSIQSEVLRSFNSGTPVTLLEATPTLNKIEGKTAPWYKVITWDGLQGWIFGSYLTLKE